MCNDQNTIPVFSLASGRHQNLASLCERGASLARLALTTLHWVSLANTQNAGLFFNYIAPMKQVCTSLAIGLVHFDRSQGSVVWTPPGEKTRSTPFTNKATFISLATVRTPCAPEARRLQLHHQHRLLQRSRLRSDPSGCDDDGRPRRRNLSSVNPLTHTDTPTPPSHLVQLAHLIRWRHFAEPRYPGYIGAGSHYYPHLRPRRPMAATGVVLGTSMYAPPLQCTIASCLWPTCIQNMGMTAA